MSTKIYRGFQVEVATLQEILRLVQAFRPEIVKRSQDLLDQFMARHNPSDPVSAWTAWRELRSKTVDQGIRLPLVDTEFSLTFFPDAGRFLGIAFTEHDAWFERWLAQPAVSEYRYWNNTDPPEGISDTEWTVRAKDWNRLVGTQQVCMAGFSIDVVSPQGPFPQVD